MKKYKNFEIILWLKPYTPYAQATEVTAISKCHRRVWKSGLILTCTMVVILKANVQKVILNTRSFWEF